MKRVDVKKILADPIQKRELLARSLIFIQAVEQGRGLTMEEARSIMERIVNEVKSR